MASLDGSNPNDEKNRMARIKNTTKLHTLGGNENGGEGREKNDAVVVGVRGLGDGNRRSSLACYLVSVPRSHSYCENATCRRPAERPLATVRRAE